MQVSLQGTTDDSGDLTVYGKNHDTQANSPRFDGWLLTQVEWVDGSFSDGVGAVLSVVDTPSGVDQTIITLTAANDDDYYFPRETIHDNTGSEVTFDGTNEATVEPQTIYGRLKLVVSSGGDTKTGGCLVTLE
jgi:hypothetical protein